MRIFLLLAMVTAASPGFDHGSLALLPVSEGPYHITMADLNGDGVDEAILPCRGELRMPSDARPGNDQLSVYYSQPDGKAPLRRDYGIGFGPYTAMVADLDGDGRKDVAVVNFQEPGGRDLSILWGQAGADPLTPAEHFRVEGGPHVYDKSRNASGEAVYPAPGLTSLVIEDFNGDGRNDIAAVAWSSDFLVVFLNDGKRRFRQSHYDLLPGPRDVVAADFDGDGVLDLAVTIYSCNLVDVLRGDGKGGFTLWRRFHSQGLTPYHLKAGDLDSDGRVDLVVGNRGPSDNVVYWRNTGDGFQHNGSARSLTVARGETTGDEFRDVLLSDIDGDGKLDLMAAAHISHKVVLWRGTGNRNFGQAFGAAVEFSFPGKGPRALARTKGGIAIAFYDSAEWGVLPLEVLRAELETQKTSHSASSTEVKR